MPAAARLGDLHTCPMVTPGTPPVPHVGGPILPPCAPVVLAGGQPAARLSDLATCVGPPDVVSQAASSVLIQGLYAARMTDRTAHGGQITVGLPTVIIGGPTFSARPITNVNGTFRYGSSILVQPDPGDSNFQSLALAALIRLDSTPTGAAAITALEGTGHGLTIIPYVPPQGWGPFNAYCMSMDGAGAATPGKGSDSVIGWSPYVHSLGGPPGSVPASSEPGADIILGHEMIHGVHNATGTSGPGPINAHGVNVSEERNTVGLPAANYQDPGGTTGPPPHGTPLPSTTGLPYTENKIRGDYADRGLATPTTGAPPVPRPSYYPPTASGGAGAPF